jgi:hypothetical protein
MHGKGRPIVWSALIAASAMLAALALDPAMPGVEPGSVLAAILDALRIPADLAGITVSNDAHHPNRIVQYVVLFATYAGLLGAIHWASIQVSALLSDRETRLHYRQRFVFAVILSVIAHVLVLGFTPKKPSALAPGPMAHSPLNVVITSPPVETRPQPPSPAETVVETPAPVPRPVPRPPRPAEAAPAPCRRSPRRRRPRRSRCRRPSPRRPWT